MNIAIVGAGPAGLMLALTVLKHRSAHRESFQITIFEREQHHDRQPRANANRSYTIDITGHGRKAIASLGPDLLVRFDKELIPFRGIEAHMLGRVMPYSDGGWTGSRGDICGALLHELEAVMLQTSDDCVFHWGTEVVDIDPDAGEITFRSAGKTETTTFDLVVGADGAGSFFRQKLEAARYLTTVKSSIPNYSRILHLDSGNPTDAFDPAFLHLFSLRPWAVGGAILNGAAARQSSDVDAATLPKDFFVQMGYWNEDPVGTADEVAGLLQSIRVRCRSEVHDNRLADYVSNDEMNAYSEREVNHTGKTVICSQLMGGRCVLLGDAATAFPPVGQGVNAALEAATVLGERLAAADPSRIDAAVAGYNASWLPQARACATIANQVVYGSRLNMLKMFALGAISDLTGIEMVGPQLAKDARLSYAQALTLTQRRQHLLYLGAALVLIGVGLLL